MPHWLYLIPLESLLIGWTVFGAIFLILKKRSRDKTQKRDRVSFATIFVQGLGFAAAWGIARKPFTPFLPGDWRFQYVVSPLVLLLVVVSIGLIASAVRTLGKQWSLQARVLETHELIRTGPYSIVRHPIYTGMFGMLVATTLAYGTWIGLLLASAIYLAGTIMRVRIEERLLREQFGAAFEEYAGKVPALFPGLRRRRR